MKTVLAALVISLLTGCATRGAGYVPVVDSKYKDPQALAQDTLECQQFAKQRMDAADGAAAGAVAGALLLAALSPRGYKNYSAQQGAIVGGVSGAAAANDTQETIIKRCLVGRGYNVLN